MSATPFAPWIGKATRTPSPFGFTPLPGLIISGLRLAITTVSVGDPLTFDFTSENRDAAPVLVAIDYIIYHQKANGTQTPKVFKLTTKTPPRRINHPRPQTPNRSPPAPTTPANTPASQINGTSPPPPPPSTSLTPE
ncbi:MAG: hypothetical protein U0232_04455 [Thermomicrobiales bacterium]